MYLVLRQILFAETFGFNSFAAYFFLAHDYLSHSYSCAYFTRINQSAQARFFQPVFAGGFGKGEKYR